MTQKHRPNCNPAIQDAIQRAAGHRTLIKQSQRPKTLIKPVAERIKSKEQVTLFVPLSGRYRFWPRLRKWIDKQSVSEVIFVHSGPQDFRAMVADDMPAFDCFWINLPDSEGLADKKRNVSLEKTVDLQMRAIYRNLSRVSTEFVFIVEDDVWPPDNALDKLMRSMDADVAGVTGDVESRQFPKQSLAWKRAALSHESGYGVEEIDGSGFGCLLLRKSAFELPMPYGTNHYDVEFCNHVKSQGWRWLIDWDVHCLHGNIVGIIPRELKLL